MNKKIADGMLKCSYLILQSSNGYTVDWVSIIFFVEYK
jgi:hypothetical protein